MAHGSVFIFVFVIIGIVGFVGLLGFMNMNNDPSVGSVVTNASEYLNDSSVVNHTYQFGQNVSASAATFVSPLPILAMVFFVAAVIMVFIVISKKR